MDERSHQPSQAPEPQEPSNVAEEQHASPDEQDIRPDSDEASGTAEDGSTADEAPSVPLGNPKLPTMLIAAAFYLILACMCITVAIAIAIRVSSGR